MAHAADSTPPITITAWQQQLRRWVLRTGIREVMDLTDASRAAIYAWIRRGNPVLPRVEMCERLDELMGVRRSA